MSTLFPEEFTSRLASQKYIDRDTLLEALSSDSPVSIRMNSVKWGSAPLSAQRVPWCETGYYLRKRPVFTLDPLYHSGCYYVQEASSMFIEQVVRDTGCDKPGLRILDLCAAPGGKTTHLSSLAGTGSVIVANEVIRSRAAILSENVTRWGLANTIVTSSDPSAFGRMGAYFDMILVDAPCSGEGMFRELPVRGEWSMANCNICSLRQWRIISDVWPALKEGGHIIYSTCTFNPDENERIIMRLAKEKRCTVRLPDISSYNGIEPVAGLFSPIGYGFHPGRIRGEGFFISVLRKEEEATAAAVRAAKPYGRKPDSFIVSSGKVFALTAEDQIEISGDVITHLPFSREEYHWLRERIRIYRAGTGMFRVKNRNIIPVHDLAISVIFRKNVLPVLELEKEEAVRYLRKDQLSVISEAERGWMTVMHRGVPLGFAKNIGGRINNYYPSEWRVRMEAKPFSDSVL
jgi:16S rRNA C967 or C1407 C5-methylase (RsmB/RsmF family)/NOL1/NOP2/fmu family ribosome biogenesis protein